MKFRYVKHEQRLAFQITEAAWPPWTWLCERCMRWKEGRLTDLPSYCQSVSGNSSIRVDREEREREERDLSFY